MFTWNKGLNAGLKGKKKDCRPCERGGSTRATLLVPLKRRPPLETPTYKSRNMVVARATLVDTRRAAIMPFRIAEREQGPAIVVLLLELVLHVLSLSIDSRSRDVRDSRWKFHQDFSSREFWNRCIRKFRIFEGRSRCVRRYYDIILWRLQDSSTFEG